MAPDGAGSFFPTNPDLADISVTTDLNFENLYFFIFCVLVHGENGLGWPQMGPSSFFPTNPDLADILGRTDLDFDNLHFLYFVDP